MGFIERVSVYTSSPDPTNQFVGGGPTLGDLGNTGIVLPATPTISQLNRYLVRLCGIRIPPDVKAVIKGIRQYVTLGAEVPLDDSDNPKIFVWEKQITTPTFKFSDGNIAWFLTKNGPQQSSGENPLPSSLASPPLGYIQEIFGVTPGILYNQLPQAIAPQPYIPPFSGTPPGVIVNNQFGVWRDIRYVWQRFSMTDNIDYEIQGPGDLCFWASVYQTNPDTRLKPSNLINCCAVAPEDAFFAEFPDLARYYRIAGELLVDFYTVDSTPLERSERINEKECREDKENKLIDKMLQFFQNSGMNISSRSSNDGNRVNQFGGQSNISSRPSGDSSRSSGDSSSSKLVNSQSSQGQQTTHSAVGSKGNPTGKR